MINLQKLRELSKLFLISGILIVPVSIIEFYYGEFYNSSILIVDSFHGFIDATSAILFSILLGVINKRSNKFPWGLYNLESISILFASMFIVYLVINYIKSALYSPLDSGPEWLSLIIYSSSLLSILIYKMEKKYSWINLVKTDMAHSKLDTFIEIFSGSAIIINNSYLTLSIVLIISGFVLFDTIRQFKEAIYSLIGFNYDSPIRERLRIMLESFGLNVKNIYVRKIGSFYSLYVIIGLDPKVTLAESYKIRKIIKRIGKTFDGVVNVEVKVIPEKSKKVKYSNNIRVPEISISNSHDEKDRTKYSTYIRGTKDTTKDINGTNIKH
ncbi:cation transporter [Acidianus sulfidivorans JP7]|uniref:Cation transporter n=1 Tax=Acidianus sulfidivorans JP7 TaxID=619593 RepID=A0A2U9IKH3_9CREN|nr:cation transporter [Acidianus sulfidivorans]AWR96542.1 cation transporter [Acidianus sulfidivorans JP7]